MSKVAPQLLLIERYDELKALGYDYRINHEGVTDLLVDMEELGITGFVDSVGGINTFGRDRFVYEDFMSEILTQGLLNIVLVRDNSDMFRDYYKYDDMFTLKMIEV